MEFELTPRIAELYNSIQKGIQGRYAMWVQDAVAWYTINNQTKGHILEIGTAFGGSAIIALKAREDAFIETTIYCVDPLEGYYGKNKPDIIIGIYPTMRMVAENLNKFGVKNWMVLQYETPPLPAELDGLMFSTALIDGNHKGRGPLDDWNIVKDRVLPGGYVMFHDVHYEDVQKAVDVANEEPGWELVQRYIVKGRGMPSQMQVTGNEKYGSHAILRKL